MTTSESSSVLSSIVQQVNFYFSDANYARDKFLREQASKNDERWILLSTITSFQRLKALGQDFEVIKKALSEASDVSFELSENGEMIRRRDMEGEVADVLSKSAYVKGFPADSSLDDLLKFFAPSKAVAVRMRRFPKSKDFKGSVFVEFSAEEACKEYLKAPLTTFKDQPLLTMSKVAYFEKKNEERKGSSKKEQFEAEFEELATGYTRGCLLKLSGLPESVPHQQVKSALQQLLPQVSVAFVEAGEEGMNMVRLKEPKASELIAAIPSDFKIDKSQVSGSLPTEEEESVYYRNLAAVMMSKRSSGKHKSRKGERRGPARSENACVKRECDGEVADDAKKVRVG